MKAFIQITFQIVIYALFCLFSIQDSTAQSLPILFKHLSIEEGLSSRNINAIYQDKMGFMWFGSDNGLNIYNGFNSTVFQHNPLDSMGISSNNIIDITEDSNGKFWIGYFANGLDIFDRESEIFTHYLHNPDVNGSISDNNVRCIFEDSQKNVWIGTAGGGLNLYDRESDSFIHFKDDPLNDADIGSNYISSIKEDKNGYLWLGSTEGILVKFDVQTKKGVSYKLYANPDDKMHNVFGKLFIDSENDVWVGTEKGLFVYNQKENSFQHFTEGNTNKNLSSNAVTSVMEFQDGLYFIATYFEGLNIYNKKTGTFSYYKSSKLIESTISNNRLVDIYKSSDGIFWFGSFVGGVNILDFSANKFQQYKNLVEPSEYGNAQKNVVSFCEDKDKNIWIGTDGEGIDIINPKTYKVKHIYSDKNNPNTLSDNVINDLYKDKDDNIWIGYYSDGMSCFNWNTKEFIHYKNDPDNPESLIGNGVWSITEDNSGNLWIGVMGSGLDEFDRASNIFKHYQNNLDDPESLTNNFVSKVYRDKEGQIWVGTLVDGLNLLNKNTSKFIRFNPESTGRNDFSGSYINDIFQDQSGNLWIGTEKALNLYKPGNSGFDHFSEETGLGGTFVVAITEDDHHNLWFTTNKGISKYNIRDNKFRNYNLSDGFQNIEFFNKCVLKSSDGKIYFGGMNGFVAFHPDSIKDNTNIPPVYITRLIVSKQHIKPRQENAILDKNISFEKSIVLTNKQASEISFEFAALNYTNSERNQYAYWLVGFDDEWKYIDNKNDVTFTNLDPGKYLLKVKASNNDGIWNDKGTSIEIIILPPWWETWIFRIVVILFIAAALIGLYYFRVNQLNNQKKVLEEKVSERTEALNNANVSLEKQHDELKHQHDLLNQMSQKILKQNKELEGHYSKLEKLVKERTHELEKAKNKAEESDRLKSAFLANMSHEIRNPMNAIVGFSTLLKEEQLTRSEKLSYIDVINSNSEVLLVLINDILDLSLIEANQLSIDKETVELNGLLEKLHSSYLLINTNDQLVIKLNNELHDQNLKILTDKTRLKQIISNLMNNAMKFTAKGSVELGLKAEDDNLIIYVKDSGIGIDKNELDTIFKRFTKSDKNKDTLYPGAGLGLSISKGLAELLSGSLTVNSVKDKGSVFTLVFPYSITSNSEPRHRKLTFNPELKNLEHKNILVVEDEKTNYLYIQKLLEKIDMNIHWAKNGKEAINLATSEINFSLVLMDIKMPVMDGYEATKIIKSRRPEMVIIALTAYARPEDYARFIKAGFHDYITKPVKPETFFSIIKKYL